MFGIFAPARANALRRSGFVRIRRASLAHAMHGPHQTSQSVVSGRVSGYMYLPRVCCPRSRPTRVHVQCPGSSRSDNNCNTTTSRLRIPSKRVPNSSISRCTCQYDEWRPPELSSTRAVAHRARCRARREIRPRGARIAYSIASRYLAASRDGYEYGSAGAGWRHRARAQAPRFRRRCLVCSLFYGWSAGQREAPVSSLPNTCIRCCSPPR